MDATDVFLCGLVWAESRNWAAGLELENALQSSDPELQVIAAAMLDQEGLCSRELIVDAVADDNTLEARLLSSQSANGVPPRSQDFWWLPPAFSFQAEPAALVENRNLLVCSSRQRFLICPVAFRPADANRHVHVTVNDASPGNPTVVS